MNFLDSDEVMALAGEYVLGVLLLEEKEEFEHELMHNRELAAAVAFWQDRLFEVAPAPSPVEPAADLWKRIERDLPGKPINRVPSGFWNNIAFWRITSMAGMAASAFLALTVLTTSLESSKPQYLAVLQAPVGGVNWLVEVDAKKVRLRPLSPITVGSGKAVEFWTKPDGAAGPTSLGLVPTDQPTEMLLSSLPGIGPNQLFEVTLEAATGSQLNRPTGPILAVGRAVRLQ